MFLCYRRADGASIAEWLFRLLDGSVYLDPNGKPCRIRLYFDQAAPGVADWKSHHLPSLQSARALMVLCTPGIARDFSNESVDWVYEEIRWWVANRGSLAPIVVDATEDSGKWVPQPIVQQWKHLNRLEIDPRRALGSEGRADGAYTESLRARIIESLRESEKASVFEEVQRYRKMNRRLAVISALLLVAAIGASWSTLIAFRESQRAREQEQTATESTDFLTHLFALADPDNTFGRTRTAEELLASGQTLLGGIMKKPLRASLMRAMGAAYTGLGDGDTAVDLVRRAQQELSGIAISPAEKFRLLHSLGEAQLYTDKWFDDAEGNLRAALVLADDSKISPSERATAHVSLGDFYAWRAPVDANRAREQYLAALQIDRTGKDTTAEARDLDRLGTLERNEKRAEHARSYYLAAIEAAKRSPPEAQPLLLAQYENDLASVLYDEGKLADARMRYESSLQEFTKVYGRESGDTAVAENNLGRILIEQDQAGSERARMLLDHAVKTQRARFGDVYVQLAFSLHNEGLVLRESGDRVTAAERFKEAAKVAQAHDSPIGGQSLTHLAEIALDQGDLKEAGARLDDAAAYFGKLKSAHDWRYALYQSARGEWELRRCNFGSAATLLEESSAKLAARWPVPNLFTRAAERRTKLFEKRSGIPGKC